MMKKIISTSIQTKHIIQCNQDKKKSILQKTKGITQIVLNCNPDYTLKAQPSLISSNLVMFSGLSWTSASRRQRP